METTSATFVRLLTGIDTVECAYYLKARENALLNFIDLTVQKEKMQNSPSVKEAPITIGGVDFLLYRGGTKSGYPFVISNKDYTIQLGETNNPSFFVKFSSEGLWREGLAALHGKFLSWADTVGFYPFRTETLSRVDFTFDYFLNELDFDENSFVTESVFDAKYRKHRKAQTFDLGKGDVKLRVYDKSAEITEASRKAWFYDLWNGRKMKVWRIEWQVRKTILRTFSLRSVSSLSIMAPLLLKYLSHRDTLRSPANDSNRSRWPLHSLWVDLQDQIAQMELLPETLFTGEDKSLHESKIRIAISVYGYLKRIAAIEQILSDRKPLMPWEALSVLEHEMKRVDDPLTWKNDVQSRVVRMRVGKW